MVRYILLISLMVSLAAARIYPQEQDQVGESEMKVAENWELSSTFDISGTPLDVYPHFFTIFDARWKQAVPDNSGWFNIERIRGSANNSAYGVYGRLIFLCKEGADFKLTLEYQEEISIFFNGKFILHNGFNPDQPVGSCEIEMSSQKGLNEIFIFLVSRSKNWKFRAFSYPALESHPVHHMMSEILWVTEKNLLSPESVVYDPDNNVLYVSNYDNLYYKQGKPTGYISRFRTDGKLLDREWITGLFAPTGMCLNDKKLYVVTRFGVVVFDTKKGEYLTQYDIQDSDFLNDIIADTLGRIYITDSSGDPDKPDIYIIDNKEVKPWLTTDLISNANGIYAYHGKLLIGNNGKRLFQSIDITNQTIDTICSLGVGTIDGICLDNQGNWLVSHWEGKVFRITEQGEITEIFDSCQNGYNTADFEYLRNDNMLVIPTYLGNHIIGLKLKY
jgi:sugar lactone lactonase YvrE